MKEIDMASTASTRTRKKTSVEASASTESALGTHSDAVRELGVQATRIQLASLTALSKFLAGWAQSSDRYGTQSATNCSAGCTARPPRANWLAAWPP
jgi:hypothetical protein